MISSKHFYNLPKPLTVADYEECVDLVKQDASSNPTIQALYLMGGEWCPGISDLDMVAVYKNSVLPVYLKSPWALGEKSKFIFTHRYLSFNEESAKWFYFFYPKEISRMRLVSGTPVLFQEPGSPREQKWTLAFILFDVLLNKLLLFPRFKKGPHNVRNLIGELYSLVYTVRIVHAITGETIGGDFEEKITTLRREWFSLEEKGVEDLIALIEPALQIVSRAVLALDRFLLQNSVPMDPDLVFSNDKYYTTFSSTWSHELFLQEFTRSLIGTIPLLNKRIESFRIVLPASFSFFFLGYASGKGEFSDEVRKHLSRPQSIPLPKEAENHREAFNVAFASSHATAGNFKIPFSFGFSFARKSVASVLVWRGVTLLRRVR